MANAVHDNKKVADPWFNERISCSECRRQTSRADEFARYAPVLLNLKWDASHITKEEIAVRVLHYRKLHLMAQTFKAPELFPEHMVFSPY
jgi:hypothetical protein